MNACIIAAEGASSSGTLLKIGIMIAVFVLAVPLARMIKRKLTWRAECEDCSHVGKDVDFWPEYRAMLCYHCYRQRRFNPQIRRYPPTG